MLKSFIKTTMRTLLKNKTYSFLNIFGLAIGIACTGLIFLWVEDEMAYDHVNVKRDNLYMVLNNWPYAEHYSTVSVTPAPMAAAMKAEIPGIANTCRYTAWQTNLLFATGDKPVYANGLYADSSVFSMFTLSFVQGNPNDAFKQLYSLVVTEKTAKKFFGDTKNVIGKTIKVDNNQDYIVTGVVKDIPANASLQFEWLAPFQIFYNQNQWLSNWEWNGVTTVVELGDNNNLASVNKQLQGFIKKKVPTSIASSMLYGMNDWYLRWSFDNGKPTGSGRIQYVHMFTAIAWIILFLACINFMNLATARSEKRAKEVGVRKVMGSGKQRLVMQFLGEAMFMSVLSGITAVFIIILVLPAFNTLSQKQLSLGLLQPMHIAALAAVTLACGFVAGSYPSLYLSSFNPVQVLKGIKLKTGSAGVIRKGLVVLQFTVSIVLIISTVIIYQQIQHVKNRDIGFDKNNLMVMDLQGSMAKNFDAIKQDLLNTGLVENAALTDHETLYGGNNTDALTWRGKDPSSKVVISTRGVSPGLLNTCGIKLLQGRDFNTNRAADSMSVIITQSLAKIMGMPNPVGQIIREDTLSFHIVGVAHDFVYGDMNGAKSDPLMFYCVPHYQDETNMYVRLKPQAGTEQAVAKIEAVMKKDNPAYPFTYKFVDDEFNQMFLSEMLVSRLSRIFAALAIIISCLGLFGLAAYTAERRTKEIGIRKVLGASVTGLAGLLSTEFVKLVGLSALMAFPLAWYAMNAWLQNYAYRITINWWVFAAAGAAAMLIAVITISFQAIKAALMNPVRSLKTE